MAPGKLDQLVGRLEDAVLRLEALLKMGESATSIERRAQAEELDKVIEKLKRDKWEVEEVYE